MRLFCFKFLLFTFSIVILLGGLEILSRKNDTSSTAFQVRYFQQNIDRLDGIAFGPSHLWRGFNPEYLDAKVASFSLFGSAPNVDVALCEKILETATPKFIIFDLSQGYLQKRHTEDWIRSRKLGYYFGIGNNNKLQDFFLIDYPLLKYLLQLKGKATYNKYGFPISVSTKKNIFKKYNYNETLIIKDAVTKVTLEKHNQIVDKYVELNKEKYQQLIENAKSKGIKVLFVSGPKYHIYNKGLRDELALQRKEFLNEVVDNKTVFFFDFERKFENTPEYFSDINHLNPEGAAAFTKELSVVLNEQIHDELK